MSEQAADPPFAVPDSPATSWVREIGFQLEPDLLAAALRQNFDVEDTDVFTLVEYGGHLCERNGRAPGDAGRETPQPFAGLSHAEVLQLRFEGERHLIADLAEPGTVGVLAGVPETYKSRLAQMIAAVIALGEGSILGRSVEAQGPVGVFWQDDSRRNEAERIQAFDAARKLPAELPVRWYLNEGLELPRDLERLRATVELRGFALVVLDSFYNFVSGISLKDEDAALIVAALKREVCDRTGSAALIVDHAPWPTEGNRGQRRAYGSVFKAAAIRWAIFLERQGSKLYVSASGNNVRGIPRTPAFWDEEASELRLVDAATVEKDYAEAREWVLAYVEQEHGKDGRHVPRGEVENAYNEAHGRKGRSRARRIIDAELGAFDAFQEMEENEREAQRATGEMHIALARGTGETKHGVYLYPFSHALSPLAEDPSARPATPLFGATESEALASLAAPPKGGGRRDGETNRGGEKVPRETPEDDEP